MTEEGQEPEKATVTLTKPEWTIVTQLISVGVRQSDDTVLEFGGRLLRQIKQQIEDSNE